MNTETQTSLHFAGQLPVGWVLVLALGLSAFMVWLYQREMRSQVGWVYHVPAYLRGAAVFLLVLALSGPVLRRTSVQRKLGRVILALDGSASMRLTDEDSSRDPNANPAELLSRWDRAQNLLFRGPVPLLDTLLADHNVELSVLRGLESTRFWWQRNQGRDRSGPKPSTVDIPANSPITSLDQALAETVDSGGAGTALVVLTDGRHTGPGSPEERAEAFSELGVPIFPIGLGTEVAPEDLSLLSVDFPESVFAEEQFRGSVRVRDTMPAGLPAIVRVLTNERILWEQPFTTTGEDSHEFEIRFPVEDLPEPPDQSDAALRMLSVRTAISGDSPPPEKTRANNDQEVAVHVLERRRKVLLVDGRPRWETRYLHNHFDRDERWEAYWAFDDYSPEGTALAAQFPATLDDLFTFDLVVVGDLGRARLPAEGASWIAKFVQERGGGLILIDGARDGLRTWAESETEPLIPVSWIDGGSVTSPLRWDLAAPGQSMPAMRLAGASAASRRIWNNLPTANYASPVRALPGAQVLASVTDASDRELPAIVFRPVGSGAVLYLASDEMWRWRYEVADRHHERFWMQVAAWIAAPPFQVDGGRIAISADRLRAESGEQVEVKVRLRDAEGGIITDANPRAWLVQDGKDVAVLELAADETHAGVYRALTPPLRPGATQIAVAESPTSGRSQERLTLHAGDEKGQEYAELTMNAPLLRSIAEASGGEFLRESEAASRLPDLLQRLDQKQSTRTERNLWSSWWWFSAIILLLTAEWLLRKRLKLI
jgi:uncharacterized membrane protein